MRNGCSAGWMLFIRTNGAGSQYRCYQIKEARRSTGLFVIRRHSVPAFRQVLRASAHLRQMEGQNDNIFQ